MDKDKLVLSLLGFSMILPGPVNRFDKNQLLQLAKLEKQGWVWFNPARGEWKVTREGEKIYASATKG